MKSTSLILAFVAGAIITGTISLTYASNKVHESGEYNSELHEELKLERAENQLLKQLLIELASFTEDKPTTM
jgi:hypothetical protein